MYLEGARCKLNIFNRHKNLFEFLMKGYYEEDEEIKLELAKKNSSMITLKNEEILKGIDTFKFKEGVEIDKLDKMLNWCADGYMRENCKEKVDMQKLEEGFIEIINFFKSNTYKGEYLSGDN